MCLIFTFKIDFLNVFIDILPVFVSTSLKYIMGTETLGKKMG